MIQQRASFNKSVMRNQQWTVIQRKKSAVSNSHLAVHGEPHG